MIKNANILKDLEESLIRDRTPLSYDEALAIFESMWKEGETLGVLPPRNPLDGIESDIRIAQILNSCLK
jgi:hypothetical protein